MDGEKVWSAFYAILQEKPDCPVITISHLKATKAAFLEWLATSEEFRVGAFILDECRGRGAGLLGVYGDEDRVVVEASEGQVVARVWKE